MISRNKTQVLSPFKSAATKLALYDHVTQCCRERVLGRGPGLPTGHWGGEGDGGKQRAYASDFSRWAVNVERHVSVDDFLTAAVPPPLCRLSLYLP